MKIIHLITALNVGGAETMLGRLLAEERHSRPDIDSRVVSLMRPGPAGECIRAAGVPLLDCGLGGWASLPGAATRLAAHLRDEQPDLIVAWMYHAHLAALAGKVLASADAPVVWNVRHSLHDLGHERIGTRAIVRAAALLSGQAAAILYNSRVAAEQYAALGYATGNSVVIPNGFDLARFRPRLEERARLGAELGIPPETMLVGLAARSHPMKDPATLAAAVRQARAAGIDAHLLLVGAGMTQPAPPLAAALAALPRERVTLRDHEPDMPSLLAGLDVLVVSSAWGEGFPNVLGEAMACAIPCVATDVGDSRWILGNTGLVVPPRAPSAMAAALCDLAAMTPGQRRELGRAARRRVESCFSLGQVTADYHRLFDSLCADRARGPLAGQRAAGIAAAG